MNSGIYAIVNKVNNNFYIGSATNIFKRKWTHESSLRADKHHSKYLQNAFNKYGEGNFSFVILAKCPVEYLLKLEQWFLDNLKPEYNILMIAGSHLGAKRSIETGLKISNSNKGKIMKEEQKKQISNKLKGKTIAERLSTSTNIITNKDIYNKLSKLRKGKPKPNKRKPIIQLDLEGNFIKEWESTIVAAKELDIPRGTITSLVTGKSKKGRKFNFKFKVC